MAIALSKVAVVDAKKYVLLLILLLVYAFNMAERSVLALVLQDIKLDLELSDTQLGLITGLAFALFYSLMGIPLARWIDTGDRIKILSVTTFFFGIVVSTIGVVTNFLQLLTVRVLVAVGEAGTIPAAQSLLGDAFDRKSRPRAMSVFMLGGPLALIIGYLVGGWLHGLVGWRMTFIVMGLPGALLGICAWIFISEPRRERRSTSRSNTTDKQQQYQAQENGRSTGGHDGEEKEDLISIFLFLWRIKTYRWLTAAFVISGFFGAGIAIWIPSFFIRTHEMSIADVGVWLAVLYGFTGLVGTYAGGELATRFAAANEKRQFQVIAILVIAVSLLGVATYLTPSRFLAFGLIGVAGLFGAVIPGPLLAAIQGITPNRYRGTAVVLLFLNLNLVGIGLGPLAAGALSDLLTPSFGDDALRYTLVALYPGYLAAAWIFWRASKTIHADLEAASSDLSNSNEAQLRNSTYESRSPGVGREARDSI